MSPYEAIERKRERLARSGNMSAEERARLNADLLNQYKNMAVSGAWVHMCCG
jgi:hypothetical protein